MSAAAGHALVLGLGPRLAAGGPTRVSGDRLGFPVVTGVVVLVRGGNRRCAVGRDATLHVGQDLSDNTDGAGETVLPAGGDDGDDGHRIRAPVAGTAYLLDLVVLVERGVDLGDMLSIAELHAEAHLVACRRQPLGVPSEIHLAKAGFLDA